MVIRRKTTVCSVIAVLFLLFVLFIPLKDIMIAAPGEYSNGKRDRSLVDLLTSSVASVVQNFPKVHNKDHTMTQHNPENQMKSLRKTLKVHNKDRSKTKQPSTTKLPSIALTLRMSSAPKLLKFFYCDLLRSTSLYWAKELGNMTVILDKESLEDKALAKHLAKDQQSFGINFNFVFERMPDGNILKYPRAKPWQYNRQLYSSFLMDDVIKEDVIAWIDTDAKFITPVTKENILKDGKLLVKGINTFSNPWMSTWDKQTKVMIGYNMPSDFMTYFPAYIWRDTITNCKNYILKYMKAKSIADAYKAAASQDFLSPVNIFLTYAYYFERHRYDWHIDITPTATGKRTTFKEYSKVHLAKGHELNQSHALPDLHVSLHTKYYKEAYNLNKQAYCAAISNTTISTAKQIADQCKEFDGKIFWSLFEFCNQPVQGHLKTWCKKDNKTCVSLIHKHYQRTRQAVNDGRYSLDLSRVKAVENSAEEMKIACPKFI